jgi:hypothetical protein
VPLLYLALLRQRREAPPTGINLLLSRRVRLDPALKYAAVPVLQGKLVFAKTPDPTSK